MDGKLMSAPFNATLTRLMRIAVGTSLFAAVLLILGASGAFAASQPSSVSAGNAPDKGKGLLSGILNPVTDLVDQTLNQVPIVTDITNEHTVGSVLTPVTAVTDQLEGRVAAVPVVGHVITPVRGVTNALVPPVVQVAGSVVTPTVGAVAQITAPVVHVAAPVIDPVTGTVKPIIDGITGGTVDVVETVVTPIVPDVPAGPSEIVELPISNSSSGTPSSQVPAVVGTSSESASAQTALDPGAAALAVLPQQSVAGSKQPAPNALARYMAASSLPTFSTSSEAIAPEASALSGSSVPARMCGVSSNGDIVSPCAPSTATSSAAGSSSTLSSGATGSFVAAHEHFWNYFHLAGAGGQLQLADWPLPASMPENPGSTPG